MGIKFTATNGVVVEPAANGGVEITLPGSGYKDYTPPAATKALEEFFAAQFKAAEA